MITSRHEYDELASRLNSVTFSGARLPKRVFRPAFVRYRFLEFDLLGHAAFWSMLQVLAEVSGDASVGTIVVEPDALSYHDDSGHYGAVNLPTSIQAGEYQSRLNWQPDERSAGALVYARILAWVPPSLQWAVWGERDLEMTLLAYAEGFDVPADADIFKRSGMYLLSAEDALDISSAAWRDRRARADFARELLSNYAPHLTSWHDRGVSRALDIAKQVSSGQIGIIAGARALTALGGKLGDDVEQALSVFRLIDGETNHLPVGDVRAYWAADALRLKDQEIARAERTYKERAITAAQTLIERLLIAD